MIHSEEKRFADMFIRPSRRQRLLYELDHPKKRYRALDRFSHSAEDLICREKVHLNGDAMEQESEFAELLASCRERCLVLSPDQYPEGVCLPLKEAVAYAQLSTEAVLILGSSFAIVYGEAMKGGREKYLLAD